MAGGARQSPANIDLTAITDGQLWPANDYAQAAARSHSECCRCPQGNKCSTRTSEHSARTV